MQSLSGLDSLFPKDRLLCDPAYLAAFESDGLTAFRTKPCAVVIPETSEEVIAVVRWCNQHEVPFVARGSGTSLSGGSLPVAEGIVIALNRLTRILRVDPFERIAVVEPGVVNQHVSNAASPHGLYYAPDPSSQTICTIGGNVAFNSGGAHCLKYGMTSNHVIGCKVVLATGEVVELGGTSVEGVGPDFTGLFCGSEGLFGIALEITLRLLPRPEKFHTVLVGYRSLQAAGDAVSAVIDSGRTRTTSSASWIVRIVDLDLPLLKRATSKSSTSSAYLDSSNGSDATYSRSLKRPKDVVMTKCECVARGGAKIDKLPEPASRIKSTASANDA